MKHFIESNSVFNDAFNYSIFPTSYININQINTASLKCLLYELIISKYINYQHIFINYINYIPTSYINQIRTGSLNRLEFYELIMLPR